jgi:two-component system, NarL family, invasion response regulator UvrY
MIDVLTPEWFDRLSRRERVVCVRLARGEDLGEIAQQLALSPSTVSTYKFRIMRKTGCRNDSQLTLLAVRGGLVA